jgi:hypothetical protein
MARAKLPPLDGPARRSTKATVWKDGYGKVNSENIRGLSPGKGAIRDQRAPSFAIGTRTMGRTTSLGPR